jgi:hypothetical protein
LGLGTIDDDDDDDNNNNLNGRDHLAGLVGVDE